MRMFCAALLASAAWLLPSALASGVALDGGLLEPGFDRLMRPILRNEEQACLLTRLGKATPHPGGQTPASLDASRLQYNGVRLSRMSGIRTVSSGPATDTGEAARVHAQSGSVPATTERVNDKVRFDARYNFEAFWKILDEKYAAFPTRLQGGKTWAQIGKEYGGALTAKSTEKELLRAIKGAARELNDAHVGIDTGKKEIDGLKSRYPYEDQMNELSDNVAAEYAKAKSKSRADGNIDYTHIGDTGYINLDTMSDYDDHSSEEDDLRIVRKSMEKILARFEQAGVKSLVIDVRNNSGGSDRVSLEIARFVQGTRSLAWNKQVRNGPDHDDLSPPVPTFVEESYEGAFQGPVAVLTSGRTLSAGETFVMAMRGRDHSVIVGEPTSGHFSDEHYAKLPNGWILSYSGERYTDEKGNDYEAQGYPPDISVAFDPDKFRAGKDVMLERALKELRRR